MVPAAPDAWLVALRDYGTMSFGDVVASAIHLARDGFAMYPLMADTLRFFAADIAAYPSSAAIYLPGGVAPAVGQVFRQHDLAATLQFMADQEAAALPVSMRRVTPSTAATSPQRLQISIATMAAW